MRYWNDTVNVLIGRRRCGNPARKKATTTAEAVVTKIPRAVGQEEAPTTCCVPNQMYAAERLASKATMNTPPLAGVSNRYCLSGSRDSDAPSRSSKWISASRPEPPKPPSRPRAPTRTHLPSSHSGTDDTRAPECSRLRLVRNGNLLRLQPSSANRGIAHSVVVVRKQFVHYLKITVHHEEVAIVHLGLVAIPIQHAR